MMRFRWGVAFGVLDWRREIGGRVSKVWDAEDACYARALWRVSDSLIVEVGPMLTVLVAREGPKCYL